MRRGAHISRSPVQRKNASQQQAVPLQFQKVPPDVGVSPIVQRRTQATPYSSSPIQLARHRIHPLSGQVPNPAWTYLGEEGPYRVYEDGQAGAAQTYDPPGGLTPFQQAREARHTAERQALLQHPFTPTEHALAPHAQTGAPLLMHPNVLALGADNRNSTALRDRIATLRGQNIHPTYLTGELYNRRLEYGALHDAQADNAEFIDFHVPNADVIHVAGGDRLMDALAIADPADRNRALEHLFRTRRGNQYGTVEEVRDILAMDLHDWDQEQQAFVRRRAN